MGLSKRKCDIKRAGKRISQNIVRQRKAHFSAKSAKKAMSGAKEKKG
jgi:hypothetical protein